MNTLDDKLHTKPFRFFLAVSKGQIRWLIPNALFYSLGDVAILIGSYFVGRVVDDLTLYGGGQARSLLIFVLLAVVGYELAYRLGHICEIVVLSRIRAQIKKRLFDHTGSLSFGFFADRFAGEITHKIATTADAFERMILVTTNSFVENGVLLISAAFALSFISPNYAIFILVWGAVFITGSLLLAREANKRASEYAAQEAKTTGTLVDIYGNIGTVKVYGKQEYVTTAHNQIDNETRSYQRMGRWDILSFNYRGIFIILLTIGLILITAGLYRQGAMSLGKIVFVSITAKQLFSVIWEMGLQFAEFIRKRGESIQNLKDLIIAPAIPDGNHTLKKPKAVSIEYANVTFGYNDKLILDDFSIAIKEKEKLGIVGLSGAGKTTIVNLILRFFEAQHGQILLNKVDIKNLTQESLRSQISYISQDTSLFHATIAENIAYGSRASSLTQIKKAAQLAYADEFIDDLPQGYASVVGERGIKLSGGQRQRIAIARAILADRPLFLLDEATSALDSDSEAKIQKGLITLMKNKTVIAVAHRLSTLSHMDRIIYLEDGRILEDGTHEALLQKNGKYAALWRMQAGGFLPKVIR